MLLDNYILSNLIGKGTFGEVYLTKKKDSDFLYATKRMTVKLVEDPKYTKFFSNEITILKRLYHKNIIRLEDLKKTKNHYYVIMEYCNGGTLTENLEKYKKLYHRPFTEEIVQHIMRQVVSAVNYMHELRIIHRDLKLDNILVKYENEIDKNQVLLLKAEIKIIDFGFAAIKDQTGLFNTAVGSPLNMDPLILKKYSTSGAVKNSELIYDEKADIWSLGTLCYQLLLGSSAFDAFNINDLISKLEEGTYKVPTNLSKEVVSFLNGMLQYEPQKRLNSGELMQHDFLVKNVSEFTQIDTSKVSKKIYGGQLNINIKANNTIWSIFNSEDEKKLNNIPSRMFANATPISESENAKKSNGNTVKNGNLLVNNPSPNISNKTINTTPAPALNIKIVSNSTPLSQNNLIFNRNNLNNPYILGQNVAQINGINMVRLIRRLPNGQIINTLVPMDKYMQIQQQNIQNGQNNIRLINGNLVNQLRQNNMNAISPNIINSPNKTLNKTPIKQINAINPTNLNQVRLAQSNTPITNGNMVVSRNIGFQNNNIGNQFNKTLPATNQINPLLNNNNIPNNKLLIGQIQPNTLIPNTNTNPNQNPLNKILLPQNHILVNKSPQRQTPNNQFALNTINIQNNFRRKKSGLNNMQIKQLNITAPLINPLNNQQKLQINNPQMIPQNQSLKTLEIQKNGIPKPQILQKNLNNGLNLTKKHYIKRLKLNIGQQNIAPSPPKMMVSQKQMRIIPLPLEGMRRMNSGTNLKQIQPLGAINRNALTPVRDFNKQMPINNNNAMQMQNIGFRNNQALNVRKFSDNNLRNSPSKNLFLIQQHLRNGISPKRNGMNNFLNISNRPNVLNNRI